MSRVRPTLTYGMWEHNREYFGVRVRFDQETTTTEPVKSDLVTQLISAWWRSSSEVLRSCESAFQICCTNNRSVKDEKHLSRQKITRLAAEAIKSCNDISLDDTRSPDIFPGQARMSSSRT